MSPSDRTGRPPEPGLTSESSVKSRPKVCVVASAGGHLTQAMLLNRAWGDLPHFVITTTHGDPVVAPRGHHSMYEVTWANRRHPWALTKMLYQCLKILRQERPDVVLSTGAAIGGICCAIGKLSGCRVVWIDSVSISDGLSLSGKLVMRFADHFLVQWPDLASRYPKATFAGSVL